MSVQLKIKSKSLAAEAVIIRKEERKQLSNARWQRDRQKDSVKAYGSYNLLHIHRVREVREEARATFLARAFMNGKPFSNVEAVAMEVGNALHDRLMNKAAGMVDRYGYDDTHTKENLEDWARG